MIVVDANVLAYFFLEGGVTEDGPLRKAFPADTVSMAAFPGLETGPGVVREVGGSGDEA